MTFDVTTISAPDAAIMRKRRQRIRNFTVNIPVLTELCRAVIASTENDYPRATYSTVDESADWLLGLESMYVVIVDATETILRYRGILRRNNAAGEVRIAGHVEGDTGLAQEDQQKVVAGDIVIVYNHRIPQSFLSRFDSTTSTFWKRWDREYEGETAEPKPQPNLGIDQQSFGNPSAITTWSAAGSFDPLGEPLNYRWELPTGVSFEAGYSDSDEIIEVNAAPGQYVIVNRVENDTTLEIKRGYRWWFVNGDSYPAFSDEFVVQDLTLNTTTKGFEGTLTVKTNRGQMPLNRLYTGAPVLITWDVYWADVGGTLEQTSEERINRRTVRGNITSFTANHDSSNRIDSVTIKFIDVLSTMNQLPMANQVVMLRDTPTEWIHAVEGMMNPGGLAYILTEYHVPSAFQTSDFYPGDMLDTSLTKANFGIMADNVGAGMTVAANFLPGANIGTTLSGQIFMRQNIAITSNAYRAAINNRHTWTIDDLCETPAIERNERMKYGECRGGGFTYVGGNTTAYRAFMGNGAQMQGTGKERMQDFIATDENDVRQKVGDWFAWINRPTESFPLVTYLDIADPALMEPHIVDIPSLDPLLSGLLDDRRALVLGANYQFDFNGNAGIPPKITLQLAPITSGKRADPEVPRELGDTYAPSPKIKVTFDSGGWIYWEIFNSHFSYPLDPEHSSEFMFMEKAPVGNGGYAAQVTGSVPSTYPYDDLPILLIDLKKDRQVTRVRYDAYCDATGTRTNMDYRLIMWQYDSNREINWLSVGNTPGGGANNPTDFFDGADLDPDWGEYPIGPDWHTINIDCTPGSPPKCRYIGIWVEIDDIVTVDPVDVDVRFDNIIIEFEE